MRAFMISFMANARVRYLLLGTGILILSVLLSLMLGAVHISPEELWTVMTTGDHASAAGRIFFYSRLPRTAACISAGAGLAVSGAILQTVLANPLAAPNIIGVNSGAALGVTICSAFSISGWTISLSAFGGAMCAVVLVVALARMTGASRLTVILSGVAVNSLLNALCETLRTFFPDSMMSTVDFRVGGFSSVSGQRLWPAALIILIGVLLSFLLANEMDVLSMGEATAHSLGLSVKRYRLALLGIAALLAGASVSFCGLLGFVGLIVPHMVRQLAGADSRWLIPLSALSGSALVTLCDLAARTLFAPHELPAGIFLAFIGAPFFLAVLIRQRGGRTHA